MIQRSKQICLANQAGYNVPDHVGEAVLLRVTRAIQRDLGLVVDEDFGPATETAISQCPSPGSVAIEDVSQVRGRQVLSTILYQLFGEECVGYVSNTMKDSLRLSLDDIYGFELGLGSASQLEKAKDNGNVRTKWGLTCGHAQTYLASVWLGDPDNRYAATGMNLPGAWNYRADKWKDLKRRSNCAVALLDGDQLVNDSDANGVHTYRMRGYADKFDHLGGCAMKDVFKGVDPLVHPYIIVEMGSHVVGCVWLDNVLSPVTTLPIRPGWYRVAADSAVPVKDHFRKSGTGCPWTFRRWWDGSPGQQKIESGDCIHRWLICSPFVPCDVLPTFEQP